MCIEFSSEKLINENLMAKISRFTVCVFVQLHAVVIPWCSGYHVSLTHSRSPVRSRAESLNFFFSPPARLIHNDDIHQNILFFITYLHVAHSLVESKCESWVSDHIFIIKTDFNSIVEISVVVCTVSTSTLWPINVH